MKESKISLLMVLFSVVLLLGACTTLPKMVKMTPEHYEDDFVIIRYAIGVNVHSFEIENKTDYEIVIDTTRCSIISTTGQTRNLNLIGLDNHIPPHSSLVLSANQATFFFNDIYDGFDLKAGGNPAITVKDKDYYDYYDEESIINSWKGKSIRLFIPVLVNSTTRIIDITLVIDGVRKAR